MAYCLARSRFFILYHRILHYSSASDATAFIPEDLHKPFPKFLLTECGFTEPEYKTLEKRFRTLKNTKCIETFRKSVHFFREFGFSEDQIKNMIIRSPTVIANNAEKTISPKLECLKKLGLSQQKIAQMTSLNPRFLTCSLEGRINPNIKVLEKVYTENTDLCRALDVAPWILCRDCKILQCLRILKESGIDGEDLRILMMRKPAVLTVAPEALTERIEFVKTLGISVLSKNYVRAVQTFGICKMETVAEKITLLQSLGFQADEIRDMLASFFWFTVRRLSFSYELGIKTFQAKPVRAPPPHLRRRVQLIRSSRLAPSVTPQLLHYLGRNWHKLPSFLCEESRVQSFGYVMHCQLFAL